MAAQHDIGSLVVLKWSGYSHLAIEENIMTTEEKKMSKIQ